MSLGLGLKKIVRTRIQTCDCKLKKISRSKCQVLIFFNDCRREEATRIFALLLLKKPSRIFTVLNK